jgi:cobalt-zinc-cadmium efflux system outer membrane protein
MVCFLVIVYRLNGHTILLSDLPIERLRVFHFSTGLSENNEAAGDYITSQSPIFPHLSEELFMPATCVEYAGEVSGRNTEHNDDRSIFPDITMKHTRSELRQYFGEVSGTPAAGMKESNPELSVNRITLRAAVAMIIMIILMISVLLTTQAQNSENKKPQKTYIEERTGHGRAPAPGQSQFALPSGVSLDDGLTENEAVAIALWNNGALHADLASLGLARADLIDAGLLRNPIAQLVLPIGPFSQFEGLFNFPFEVFWQRKRRMEFANAEIIRVARSLEQTALNLARDVRVSYSDLLLSQDRARLAVESVNLRKDIARLTDIRLRAGDVSEIEASATQLDLSFANEQSIRLQREIILARDRLRNLMGMGPEQPDFVPQSSSAQMINVALKNGLPLIEEFLKRAYESRPDLRAAELGIEAATKRAKWEHSRIIALSGLLNIKQGEGLDFSPRPGVLLDLPVFNRNQGGISRADAEVERATWQYLSVRQRITLEVQEAYNLLLQGRELLDLWHHQILPQAEDNVRLSGRAFNNGEQSYLFVLDATRRLVDAHLREAELEADIRRANAQLDRSVGRKLDEKP